MNKENMNEYIPIVFATDDGYALPTSVAITSMIKNKHKCTKYKIYILSPFLSADNYKALQSFDSKDCKVVIIIAKEILNNKLSTLDKVTNTDYYRLMLDSFIDEDKVIALDGDILVLDDLTSLYNQQLEGNYIGGCYFRPHDVYNRQYVQDCLGLNEGKRINIGVMLMDLKKIREYNLQEKFVENIGRFQTMSEDIINYVCKDKIKLIPIKYNYNLHFYKYSYMLKSCPVYSFNEYIEAEQKPIIFHYTLQKPWKENVQYHQRLWFNYLKYTPYKKIKIKISKEKSMIQTIFSVRNSDDKSHKIITILGMKLKFKKHSKVTL